VQQVYPYGAVQVWSERTVTFKVNGQQLKVYTHEEPIGENMTIFFVDESTFTKVDAMIISPREDHKAL
jgi:hypothetical protein